MADSLAQIREQLIALLPRLRRFARTLTQHRDDADDLVQVALEKALTRCDQWDVNSRLDSWMFTIIRNAWIDEVRARQRRGGVHIDIAEVVESADEAQRDDRIDMYAIRQALLRLPEEQRTAVNLVLIEGLSYKEAADVMAVPIGTLTSRLARGREALQKMLNAELDVGEGR